MKTLEKKIGMKIGVDESTDLPFSLSILEKNSQGKLNKIKKRFPTLPEPIVSSHNKVDSRKYVEIGNAYDKDYRGRTGNAISKK